jgi:hypothetical protein
VDLIDTPLARMSALIALLVCFGGLIYLAARVRDAVSRRPRQPSPRLGPQPGSLEYAVLGADNERTEDLKLPVYIAHHRQPAVGVLRLRKEPVPQQKEITSHAK